MNKLKSFDNFYNSLIINENEKSEREIELNREISNTKNLIEFIKKSIPIDNVEKDVQQIAYEYNRILQNLKRSVEDTNILPQLEEYLKTLSHLLRLEMIINPRLYTSVFSERTGVKSINAKSTFLLRNGEKKLVSVYVGKFDDLKSKDSEEIMDIARKKMRVKLKELL